MESWLQFGETKIQLNEILHNPEARFQNDFANTSIDFIRDWIHGKESFTLHTSGSTGTPKPISVSRHQLTASAQLTIEALSLHKNQTSLICLDTRYVAGIMMIVRSLEAGMNMVLIEPVANPLERLNENTLIDFVALVPLQMETILHSNQKEKLNKIKSILIGGAHINSSIISELQTLNCNCYGTYGMTETLSHVALRKLNGVDKQEFFTALPGILMETDDRGCLVIHARHLQEEPFYTNDMVELISPYQFNWIGRADTIINSGGVKVIPEKVETEIQKYFDNHKIFNRFFVFGFPDSLLGNSVNLIIEGSKFNEKTEDQLVTFLKHTLTRFELPRAIRYVDKFVHTATNKINKIETVRLLTTH
jgi:o-succinylbenzoate---CoA ligase